MSFGNLVEFEQGFQQFSAMWKNLTFRNNRTHKGMTEKKIMIISGFLKALPDSSG